MRYTDSPREGYFNHGYFYKEDDKWYVDCYPYRHRFEPTTIIGPFDTWEEAQDALLKVP